MSVRIATYTLFLLLVTTATLTAQITGAITGTVVDTSGAVVPNAAVVIRNLGTGSERTATTEANGRFLVEALPVGMYQVDVTAQGFKKAVRAGLQLNVADRLAVDFRLELGQMTETISVTAEAPLVKTETGDLSYLVTTQQITELSINNRNFLSVQQLIPGASRTAADEQGIGLTGGKGFAINGQREKYSGLMLDGVQNTDMGNQSTQMTYPGMETISEVKILSSNYSAEYGTAGGANMLVVTRSGTRDFHGAAYEYVRNDKTSLLRASLPCASIILVIASAGPSSFPGSTTGTGTRRSSSSRRSGAGAARPRSFAPPRRPKRCGTAISRPRRTGLGNPSSTRRRDKRFRTTGFQPAGSTKMRGFCWITFSLSLTPPAFSTSCRTSRFRKTGARSSYA